jgi:hypothetical protein
VPWSARVLWEVVDEQGGFDEVTDNKLWSKVGKETLERMGNPVSLKGFTTISFHTKAAYRTMFPFFCPS